jgi:Na+:H+ antiporter, NhaC family
MSTQTSEIERPSLVMALLPILITFFLLGLQLFYFGDFTPHIPLAMGLAITATLGWFRGYRWSDIEDGAFNVVRVAIPAIAILMIIGMIIAIWIASGTVPLIMYYGFMVLNPEIFLAAALLLCSVVSLCLGTSWTTAGTVGLALMGIGSGFGIPMYWTAGAVISGSYFGDKMSPLSDTTNLAPAVTGVDLFDHIRNMTPTTVPAMLIALVVYLFVGFNVIEITQVDTSRIDQFSTALATHFNLSPILLLPVFLVIILALKRMPAIPILFASVLTSLVLAITVQGASFHETLTYLQSGFNVDSGNTGLDSLLNRGGIQSMTWLITLVMIALSFGGALEKTRCLESIVTAMLGRNRSFLKLHSAATATAVGTNIITGDPYLSLTLPGRMYAPSYRKMGYSPLSLSRAIEDGGTLTAPLIPWNAGGAFMISALGLGISEGNTENLLYIVCAISCWLSPLLGIAYAALGRFSPKATPEEVRQWEENGEPILKPIEDEVQDVLIRVY